MKWIVLSSVEMPAGQGWAVVYGDVDELRQIPEGRGSDFPETAWAAMVQQLTDDD